MKALPTPAAPRGLSVKRLPGKPGARAPSPLRPVALCCMLACGGLPMAALACDAGTVDQLNGCLRGTDATINLTADIKLDGAHHIEVVTRNVTINGTVNGVRHVIDGGGTQRGFLVGEGNVVLRDLEMTRLLAAGGDGGGNAQSSSGGGGMGAGAAVFVRSGATVTLDNVTLLDNKAVGGNGGSVSGWGIGATGGGGMGGNGGQGDVGTHGTQGGGLFNAGGGPGAGSGSTAIDYDGGGGGAGSSAGGTGGFGGGGGGGRFGDGARTPDGFERPSPGGQGGFGGGGGGGGPAAGPDSRLRGQIGGAGGFGGGGGGAQVDKDGRPGEGGFGGGDGSKSGGGGAGMGGAIFVGGRGALSSPDPSRRRQCREWRPRRSRPTFLSPPRIGLRLRHLPAGQQRQPFQPQVQRQRRCHPSVANDIADETGSVGPVHAGSIGMTKDGAGTLVLTGDNTYGGTTTIAAARCKSATARPAAAGQRRGQHRHHGTLAFNRSDVSRWPTPSAAAARWSGPRHRCCSPATTPTPAAPASRRHAAGRRRRHQRQPGRGQRHPVQQRHAGLQPQRRPGRSRWPTPSAAAATSPRTAASTLVLTGNNELRRRHHHRRRHAAGRQRRQPAASWATTPSASPATPRWPSTAAIRSCPTNTISGEGSVAQHGQRQHLPDGRQHLHRRHHHRRRHGGHRPGPGAGRGKDHAQRWNAGRPRRDERPGSDSRAWPTRAGHPRRHDQHHRRGPNTT